MESRLISDVTSMCESPCRSSVGLSKDDIAYLCSMTLLSFLLEVQHQVSVEMQALPYFWHCVYIQRLGPFLGGLKC